MKLVSLQEETWENSFTLLPREDSEKTAIHKRESGYTPDTELVP